MESTTLYFMSIVTFKINFVIQIKNQRSYLLPSKMILTISDSLTLRTDFPYRSHLL